MPAPPGRQWWTHWNLSYTDESGPFGILRGAHSVQEATYRTLEKWFPTYIEEVNRQIGEDVLRVPKRYTRRPDERTLSKYVDASVLVTTSETTHVDRHGDGSVHSVWVTTIEMHVFGTQDFLETQAITMAYTTVARAILAQHPDLGGEVQTLLWHGESFKYGETSSTRYVGLGETVFHITVDTTMNDRRGPPLTEWTPKGYPASPTVASLPPYGGTEDTDVTVQNTEVTT